MAGVPTAQERNKKKLTPLAQSKLFKRLREWGEYKSIKLLDNAILNGWQVPYDYPVKQNEVSVKEKYKSTFLN